MPRLRMLVLAVLLALTAAACAGSGLAPEEGLTASPLPGETLVPGDGAGEATTDPAEGATEDPTDGTGDGTGDDAATDDAAGQDGAGSGGDGSGTAGGEQGGDGAGGTAALTPLVDGGPVGANAAAYLRGDRARVVLEVDIQDGANYPSSVIDHVSSILARESAATVEVQTGPATSTRRDAWTPDQLRAAAAETRSVAHGDDVAVLHLLVLRDGYQDDGVLGLAFGSSSAVVFPDRWSDLTTALLSGDRIARAVSTHEVGHLLGLVGLYEAPTSDHEDPEHPGHTTDRNDVMYYAVERAIISQLDGIPTDFGSATRADLAAIREG